MSSSSERKSSEKIPLLQKKPSSNKDYSIQELQDILKKYCKSTPKLSSKKPTPKKSKTPTPPRRMESSEEKKEEYERKSETPPKKSSKKPSPKPQPKPAPKKKKPLRKNTPASNETVLLKELLEKEGIEKCDKKLTIGKMTELYKKYKDVPRYENVFTGFSTRKKKGDKCTCLSIPL